MGKPDHQPADSRDIENLRLRNLVDALAQTIGHAGTEITRLKSLVDALCGTITVAAARDALLVDR